MIFTFSGKVKAEPCSNGDSAAKSDAEQWLAVLDCHSFWRFWKVGNRAISTGEHRVCTFFHLILPPFFSEPSFGYTSCFTLEPIENPVQYIILLWVLWIATYIFMPATCPYFSVHSCDNKEKTLPIKCFIELEYSPLPVLSAYRLNNPFHSHNKAKHTRPTTATSPSLCYSWVATGSSTNYFYYPLCILIISHWCRCIFNSSTFTH